MSVSRSFPTVSLMVRHAGKILRPRIFIPTILVLSVLGVTAWILWPVAVTKHNLRLGREGDFYIDQMDALCWAAACSRLSRNHLWRVLEDEWGQNTASAAAIVLMLVLPEEEIESSLLPWVIERYSEQELATLSANELSEVQTLLISLVVESASDQDPWWASTLAECADPSWELEPRTMALMEAHILNSDAIEPAFSLHWYGEERPRVLSQFPRLAASPTLALSPDGSRLACLYGQQIRVYDLLERTVIREFEWAGFQWAGCRHLTISPDNQFLLAAGTGPRPIILMWDLAAGSLVHSVETHTSIITDVAFSPDGELLVSCGDREVIVRETESFDVVQEWSVREQRLAKFTPGLDAIVTVGEDGQVSMRRISGDGATLATVSLAPPIFELHLCDDGSRVIVGGWLGITEWSWDEPMTALRTLTLPLGTVCYDFTADGERALIRGRTPHGSLIDADTGAEIAQLVGTNGSSSWELSDSGDLAVACGHRGEIRTYDLSSVVAIASPEVSSEAP